MSEKGKHPGGRPSIYKPEMCERLIEEMARGLGYEAATAAIGISYEAMYDWCNPDSPRFKPEFLQAKAEGDRQNRLFWEKLGIEGAMGSPNFSATPWVFTMKNRFGWRDKVEHTGDKNAPIHTQSKVLNVIGESPRREASDDDDQNT